MRKPLQDYIRFSMSLDSGYLMDSDLIATKNSYLGRLVQPFLEYCPGNEVPLLPGKGPDHFTFGLPQFRGIETRCNTVWISQKNQLNIQNIVYHHFRLHFQMYADDKIRYRREIHTAKGAIKDTILDFCASVNIKFDAITLEMLSKAYYRSRIKREKNGFSPCKPVMIGRLFYLV